MVNKNALEDVPSCKLKNNDKHFDCISSTVPTKEFRDIWFDFSYSKTWQIKQQSRNTSYNELNT